MSSDLSAARRAPRELSHAELEVDGRTCRSCAARTEKSLNRLDGVVASINFATETATVAYDPDRADVDHLVAAVAAIGYTARLRRRQPGTLAARRALRPEPGTVATTRACCGDDVLGSYQVAGQPETAAGALSRHAAEVGIPGQHRAAPAVNSSGER
jgi:copper chaperone CopZ